MSMTNGADGGAVRPGVRESWERCRRAGLDPRAEPVGVGAAELEARLVAGAELIRVAGPHLSWITAAHGAIPHAFCLTDGDGIVLHAVGNDAELLRRCRLGPGHDRSEAAVGTNSAGTALFEGVPMTVAGAEHFLEACRGWHGTASPIRAPGGEIVGVLDLVTTMSDDELGRLVLVTYVARMIEEGLVARVARSPEAGGPAARPEPRSRADALGRRITESGMIGLVHWELDGRIRFANDHFLEIVGYTREDVEAGRLNWQSLTPPDWAEFDEMIVEQVLATGVAGPFEKECLRRDGTRVPLLLSIASFEETRERGVTLAVDMSQRKRVENELRLRQVTAERAVRDRDELVAIVSHDLRNPLNTIAMASSLLLEDIPAGRKKAQAMIIRRSVEGMLRLLEDLLDVSRIGAARLTVDASEDEACEVVRAAVELASPLAGARGVAVCAELPDEPVMVHADRERILQVFSNLIGNALKHTPAGGMITVRVTPGGDEVAFTVSDTGPGFGVADLPHLFEAFWQGADQVGGSGLGLAICRGIVEAHGGWIGAENLEGGGARVTFTLPLPEAASSSTANAILRG